jgi:phosphatidate cytidylyltransferase
MLTRTLSAIIGVGLWLAICFGGPLPFLGGVTVLAALGIAEFVASYRRALALEAASGESSLTPNGWLNGALAWSGLALPSLAYWLRLHPGRLLWAYALLPTLAIGVFTVLVLRAVRTGQTLGRGRALYGLVGMIYIGMLFSSFVLLRGLPGRISVRPFGWTDRGAWLMMFVALCVWATDTAAYLVGRRFGRHKLSPTLSPSKTLEGAVGGFGGALLAGAVFGMWIHLPLVHSLVVAAIAGGIGQVGDLFESALKREIGIKDFGRVMPGHGGTLDRFDSLLYVTPLAYLYLRLLLRHF